MARCYHLLATIIKRANQVSNNCIMGEKEPKVFHQAIAKEWYKRRIMK
jgi:hypothetical protein